MRASTSSRAGPIGAPRWRRAGRAQRERPVLIHTDVNEMKMVATQVPCFDLSMFCRACTSGFAILLAASGCAPAVSEVSSSEGNESDASTTSGGTATEPTGGGARGPRRRLRPVRGPETGSQASRPRWAMARSGTAPPQAPVTPYVVMRSAKPGEKRACIVCHRSGRLASTPCRTRASSLRTSAAHRRSLLRCSSRVLLPKTVPMTPLACGRPRSATRSSSVDRWPARPNVAARRSYGLSATLSPIAQIVRLLATTLSSWASPSRPASSPAPNSRRRRHEESRGGDSEHRGQMREGVGVRAWDLHSADVAHRRVFDVNVLEPGEAREVFEDALVRNRRLAEVNAAKPRH